VISEKLRRNDVQRDAASRKPLGGRGLRGARKRGDTPFA
jgi:hypothetical protein